MSDVEKKVTEEVEMPKDKKKKKKVLAILLPILAVFLALVIAVVMSVACGFFSVYIPYKSYFKHRYAIQNVVRDDD